MPDANWQCPLCGCNDYRRWPTEWPNSYYQCCDCSVFFGDPKRFNGRLVAQEALPASGGVSIDHPVKLVR